ncbi:multi-sensor hybrid histidine kinase [Pseudomonas delhiensis]|uniref:histidine kinase n=1 Tax=Pseudomonas delhiensis TaxID=366289 RepID=A0A239KE04_9PSED|nr:transporter substrate-binding domain-containing protein [Pseudomonas delhiensis]SDJ30633.1 multi-sensor hybrid histidine kinase [Pseudomonas delhiensis]SNT15942.1 multi-sensor hybrid histidine kinase [Pseudomonas delhiensis]
MRICIVFLVCVLAWIRTGYCAPYESDVQLELYSRANSEHKELDLGSEQWKWLRKKGRLVVGVSEPDYRPFDITINDDRYEGITADVLGLISRYLGVNVVIRSFPDRNKAIEALKSGETDLLASANGYDATDVSILLTTPYAPDQPALFSRLNDSRIFNGQLDGVRVAVPYDYITRDVVLNNFQGSLVEFYKSRQEALAALAFGRADLYLGDILSSNLLINENYFNFVKIERMVDINTRGTSFAIRRNDELLLGIVNSAIKAIDRKDYDEILRRWAGGTQAITAKKIELTDGEREWISKHPIVRIAVSLDQAPIAFMDSDGNFSGIASDILKIASFNTGIKFEPVYLDRVSDLQSAVLDGKAELACLTKIPSREEFLRFTENFAYSPFVVMTNNKNTNIISLEQLRGKRVAIPKGHVVIEKLRRFYPDIDIVETSNLFESMDAVSSGEVLATIAPMGIARFYSDRVEGLNISINNVIDVDGARFPFVMKRSDVELQSILDKVLADIPPDELNVISSRWRGNPAVRIKSWKDYRPLIIQIVSVAILLLAVSFVWNAYLRRQIAQKNQAKQALDEQLLFMQALINGTPHPIYVRDKEGRLLSCNKYYLQAIGRELEDVVGKYSFEGVKANHKEASALHSDYLRVMRTDTPFEMDRTLHLRGGATTVYHWIYPYKASNGDTQGVICGWIDISERRRLIEELKTAKDLADAASRAKTTFLATMSHEIRTPMNAIIGLLELSIRGSETIDRTLIEVAHDSAISLLELIGDILDVVRIESGSLAILPRRASIIELSESVLRVFNGLARQKNLSLSLHCNEAVAGEFMVDPVRYKQILSNLVGNSIKFTDVGGVVVNLSGVSKGNSMVEVEVTVEDTGIGITEVDQSKLFEPFEQVEAQEHAARGGTGLGLAICRSLAELMGGSLSLSSKLGVGTCVSLKLCLSALESQEISEQVDESPLFQGDLKSLNILVVDDNSANRLVLSQQLSYLQHDVISAADGAEAFRIWRSGDFDIVITDCNMPVMNGYEFTRNIRDAEFKRGAKPVVVFGFTANAQPEEVQRCVAAGMNDCLFKPVTIDDLDKVIRKWMASISDSAQVSRVGVLPIEPGRHLKGEAGEAKFDLAPLRRVAKENNEVLRLMLVEFLKTNREDLEKLLACWRARDLSGLSEIAHKLKGGAKFLHALDLIEACQAVEILARDVATDFDDLELAVDVVKDEAEEVIAALAMEIDRLAAG